MRLLACFGRFLTTTTTAATPTTSENQRRRERARDSDKTTSSKTQNAALFSIVAISVERAPLQGEQFAATQSEQRGQKTSLARVAFVSLLRCCNASTSNVESVNSQSRFLRALCIQPFFCFDHHRSPDCRPRRRRRRRRRRHRRRRRRIFFFVVFELLLSSFFA